MKKRSSAKTPARIGRRSAGKPVFYGNETHLQILKESLRRRTPHFWNQWRQRHPRIAPDLRGLVLVGGLLRGFHLTRARLDNAILMRADLAGVHLERASLKGARLISAELSSVHAEKANLSGANRRNATLQQSDFRGAVCLDRTYLAHANLREANFTRARMIEATLSQANLTRTCFDGADLTGHPSTMRFLTRHRSWERSSRELMSSERSFVELRLMPKQTNADYLSMCTLPGSGAQER